MNEIKLMPHNQQMIERIETAMVFGNHKIFYSEATGLGKSYIMMYLIYKYFRDKKVLYICPKNYIWYNLSVYPEFELIKDCVTMTCNADFNKLKLTHLGYDAIFIDEAHHLIAPVQGETIRKMIEETIKKNPAAYVFGFTATPYVNGQMIGDLYFDTSIMGLDLESAITAKILQKINYAVAINDTIVLTPEEKDYTAKFNVDTTNFTVRKIVDQYSGVNHWLVYFPLISELNANIAYFEKYFPEFKLFVIHSEIDDCENILYKFDHYDGKAFLLTVSMVLEGIHPTTADGILLYRNVSSDITFLQVLGRLGIIDPARTPIFVDIYSSYDNFLRSGFLRTFAENGDGNERHNIRTTILMSSSSFQFIELSDVIARLRRIYEYHEYRGYTWSSDRELCSKLGKSATYVFIRRNNGKSYEEIIDEYLDGCYHEYHGIQWTSDVELSLKLGKSDGFVRRRLRKGQTHEEIIDSVLANPTEVREYRGIQWTNNHELSLKLGKNDGFVRKRLQKGQTYEEIIDEFLDGCQHEYRGIQWTSDPELSLKLGKAGGFIRKRLQKGQTYEEIIDEFLDGCQHEYRGIQWMSDKDLSLKLGKSVTFVCQRLQKGQTYEEIIDEFLDGCSHEYRGIQWTNNTELSLKLGKAGGFIRKRLQKGQTYEEIIDEFLDGCSHEYRGIQWTSDAELSRKLGKSVSFVCQRLQKGQTYEEIIDMVLEKNIDH